MGLACRQAFSPYSRINQVPVEQVRAHLITVFERWGQPGSLRVDNGEPFGSPKASCTTALAFWLIGHDIDVIWNKPRCPQMNGKVEKMQDTTARWAEIDQCASRTQLQQQLNSEIIVQREQFPVTRLKNATRLNVFPELETSRRPFQTERFDPQRVYRFLAPKIYVRKVSSCGRITHFGQPVHVGLAQKGQFVRLQFDPQHVAWNLFDNQTLFKTIPAPNLQLEPLIQLTVFQRTSVVQQE